MRVPCATLRSRGAQTSPDVAPAFGTRPSGSEPAVMILPSPPTRYFHDGLCRDGKKQKTVKPHSCGDFSTSLGTRDTMSCILRSSPQNGSTPVPPMLKRPCTNGTAPLYEPSSLP